MSAPFGQQETTYQVKDRFALAVSIEALIMKEHLNAEFGMWSAERSRDGGRKVLVLTPLNLGGFPFSPDRKSGKKAEITNRVAANFAGWEKDHALFDREPEEIIRVLRAGADAGEQPPAPRL